MSGQDQDIVGRWNIVAWEQRYDDGRVVRPMGDALAGFILYSPDGTMACFIGRAEREAFRSGLQWEADDAEKVRAFDSLMSYGGRYRRDGARVEHHVDISSFPNWTGGVQKRTADLQGDTLTISARLEEGTRDARSAVLIWRRA